MTTVTESDHHEVEWQFDAVDPRPVERWLVDLGSESGLAVSGRLSRELRDTYFDTDDWRIHRAGFTLRVRASDGRIETTLKSRAGAVDGLRTRREITEALDGEPSEALTAGSGPVAARVRALAGSKPLRPMFAFETNRRAYRLTLDGSPAGELTLDETRIPMGDGMEPVRLSRIEVETSGEHVDRLRPYLDQLAAACGLQPAAVSKFELALIAHGLNVGQPVELGPTEIHRDMSIADLAFAVLRRHFAAFLAHEPGSRLGDDPEEVHDMRVAARRMRAAMSLFSSFLPLTAERMRDELRWVASALGGVRDIDVQREQLQGWIEESSPDDREALAELDAVLARRRDTARVAMLDALDSPRYERFVDTFSTMLRCANGKTEGPAARPALAVAPDLVGRRYRRFRKLGDQISPTSPPEEYHALRIQGKRLRYALEFFQPLYGKRARTMIQTLVELQDLLGAHQDAEVAIDHLRELATAADGELRGRTIFVMGKIAARYEREAREARERFPTLYKALRGKAWKEVEREMRRLRPAREPKATDDQPSPAETEAEAATSDRSPE